MSIRTSKTKVTGRLLRVRNEYSGRYRFHISGCDVGTDEQTFMLSSEKALAIANVDAAFPLGVTIKVTGRFADIPGDRNVRQLLHVKIVSVDGVEVRAWSERVGSTQVADDTLRAAKARVEEAKASEDAAMADRSPPEQTNAITDPNIAFENAMRIVRRQRKLKNPKLSQQEIWQLRDALNLLAEKLGIVQ
jgi:hypothetical protein